MFNRQIDLETMEGITEGAIRECTLGGERKKEETMVFKQAGYQ